MNESLIGFICAGLVVVMFFALGVGTIALGIRNRRKAEASQSWPAAPGIITASWIEENSDTDDDGFRSYTYKPRWKYQYMIGQDTYTSDRISFGGSKSYNRKRQAEDELVKYPVNSQVRVYFNPQDPTETTLIRGTKGTLGTIITGIVLLILSICGCGGVLFMVSEAL